jgi:DNA polymerase-3 subunit alpha
VYQEQIMQIAQLLGGYTLGQADLLRRAMGKKKPEEMEKQRAIFMEGCSKNGIANEISNNLFDIMVQFAEYCFNKSHSQAYAFLTYQTAYLKTHYPVEYMTALLSSVSSEQDKVQGYIAECQAMGIDILPPDINVSGGDFTADGNTIRFGMSGVRNVGEQAVIEVVARREEGGPYKSIQDFIQRVDLRVVNKRALEALIKCGALLSLGVSRKQALENLDSLVDTAQRKQAQQSVGQISLFSIATGSDGTTQEDLMMQLRGDDSEFMERELQSMEHELLGFYVTSHPLQRVMNRLRWLTTHSMRDVKEAKDGSTVIIGGLASSIEKKLTKTNKMLAILHMEDLGGKMEVVIYGETLEKLPQEVLIPQSLLLIRGKVKKGDEGEVSVMANTVRRISDANLVNVFFKTQQSFTDLHRLKHILSLHKGEDPVLLHFPQGKRSQAILVGCQFWVNASSPELAAAIDAGFSPTAKVLVNRVQV